MRHNDDSPSSERFREIALILAQGVLRLHSHAALADGLTRPKDSENLSKSSQNRLAVPGETALTVHTG